MKGRLLDVNMKIQLAVMPHRSVGECLRNNKVTYVVEGQAEVADIRFSPTSLPCTMLGSGPVRSP